MSRIASIKRIDDEQGLDEVIVGILEREPCDVHAIRRKLVKSARGALFNQHALGGRDAVISIEALLVRLMGMWKNGFIEPVGDPLQVYSQFWQWRVL